MRNYLLIVLLAFVVASCRKDGRDGETILKGTAKVLVDESIYPMVEDQVAVFETDYDAKINLLARSEAEAIQAFFKDSAQIIILPRPLNDDERKIFASRKMFPETAKIASDAVALIAHQSFKDSTVALADVVAFMKGARTSSTIKGLVFDNPNSSTMRLLNERATSTISEQDDVYSFQTSEQVIEFIADNAGMIGIVGMNWLTQPSKESATVLENVKILSVKDINGDRYIYPSQNNLAEGTYPLARDLYIVNAQGYSGLGVGFSTFIAGDRGQRIILKAGLLPVRMPSRQINTRSKSENKK